MTKLSAKLTKANKIIIIGLVNNQKSSFGQLFKKFRLKSGFATLEEFGDALAEEGHIFETSLFSHWQKNTRAPKNRKLLLAVIKIFIKKNGISSINEINSLFESLKWGYLTNEEAKNISEEESDPLIEMGSASHILNFLTKTIESKKILRRGWVRERINNPESVAEHSFQLGVMVLIFADKLGLDKSKLLTMAILHDLGEVFTGDIVWSRGKIINIEKRTIKEEAEIKGILKLFKTISAEKKFIGIFKEMIERKTPEAEIFWQLDKLEMAIQALQYEIENKKKLDEFFINAEFHIYTPFLKKILKEAIKRRPKLK